MPAGRLSPEQILRVWIDAVDPEYARGVLSDPDSAAAIGQMVEALALVSAACDETTQEMYSQHYSGQSAPPASGAAYSSVTLSISRSLLLSEPLVVEAGSLVEEVQADASPEGAIEAPTGRRYALQSRIVFFPGESGAAGERVADEPRAVLAVAERAGRGFDFPLPGSIRALSQPGMGLENDGASVVPGDASPHLLVAAPRPDAPIPDLVGRSVEITAGANLGQVRRVVGYLPPNPPGDAGTLLLARDALVRLTAGAGTFQVGEEVTFGAGGLARLIDYDPLFPALTDNYALIENLGSLPLSLVAIAGATSGATATISAIERSESMAADAETAAWRVVDPVAEHGLSFANALSPAGGRDTTLDSIAWERGSLRAPGESDEELRARIADPSDAVTPMAVVRAGNRAVAPFGAEVVLREAGAEGLPGAYADVDAFDNDAVAVLNGATAVGSFVGGELVRQEATGATGVAVVGTPAALGPVTPSILVGIARVSGTFVAGSPIANEAGATIAAPAITGGMREQERYRLGLSYAEMRGYFLIGTSHRGQGEFGCAFDAHPYGFFDSSPALSFFDGFAVTSAITAQRLWQAIDEVRAAGVGFTLVEEGRGA